MKSFIRNGSKAAVIAAALTIASSAFAAPFWQDPGTASDGTFADEVVKIVPDTKTVGVYRNETVRFIDAATGQSFAWRFDTTEDVVNLDQVAPAGALGGQHVAAYVWDRDGNGGE
jgi:hypothetical protein